MYIFFPANIFPSWLQRPIVNRKFIRRKFRFKRVHLRVIHKKRRKKRKLIHLRLSFDAEWKTRCALHTHKTRNCITQSFLFMKKSNSIVTIAAVHRLELIESNTRALLMALSWPHILTSSNNASSRRRVVRKWQMSFRLNDSIYAKSYRKKPIRSSNVRAQKCIVNNFNQNRIAFVNVFQKKIIAQVTRTLISVNNARSNDEFFFEKFVCTDLENPTIARSSIVIEQPHYFIAMNSIKNYCLPFVKLLMQVDLVIIILYLYDYELSLLVRTAARTFTYTVCEHYHFRISMHQIRFHDFTYSGYVVDRTIVQMSRFQSDYCYIVIP